MSVAEWETEEAEQVDHSSLHGARRLAEKINAVWAARGIKANARPVYMRFHEAMRGGYYAIVSDLIVDREAGVRTQQERGE